jgi:hypothetical protein
MFFYLGEWGWLTFSALLLLLVKVDIIMIRYILLFVIKCFELTRINKTV